MLLLAAPPFTQSNPVSHGVWWVALLLALVIGVIVAIDVLDWVWQRLMHRRTGSGPAGYEPGGFHVRRPDGEVRHRHYREPPKIGRDHRSTGGLPHRQALDLGRGHIAVRHHGEPGALRRAGPRARSVTVVAESSVFCEIVA
jgi:hypothetical protein